MTARPSLADDAALMTFPAGRTILLIAVFAVVGAIGVAVRLGPAQEADQTVWVFDPAHRETYESPIIRQSSLVALHRQSTGKQARIQLMPARALDARLLSLILSRTTGGEVPDLVEIEIGSVGKYFRSPSGDPGLLPLDGFLAKDPLAGQLLPARLASWSYNGHVYGVPLDVHPVTITFRDDLFHAAGVDLAAAATWREFREACLRYQSYWEGRGERRYALQLARWTASDLMILLRQQRIDLLAADGSPRIASPAVARTIAFYARLVAGTDAIGTPVSDAMAALDLAEGHTGALFTPDWRVDYLRTQPSLAGKLRMMPLPKFAESDAPTASWGGTMAAIPRNARDPQASWELLRDLQLTSQAIKARLDRSSTLPAIQSAWDDPILKRPDSLFSGQSIFEVYADLARQLPAQRPSPYATVISQALAGVLREAQDYLQKHSAEGLEAFCEERLAVAQANLSRLMDFAEGRP